MKKVLVSVPLPLYEQIDQFMKTWGFPSKAEFFRHAVMTYLSQNERQKEARKLGVKLPLSSF